MKKILKLIIPVITLTILISLLLFRTGSRNNMAEAATAFKSLQTADIYEELYVYASVPNESEAKIDTIWSNILDSFGMKFKNPVISFDKDGAKQEEWQADDDKVFAGMTKTSHRDNFSLYVNINTSDNDFELQNSITDMEKIFNAQNLKCEVTLSIKGTKLGKLNMDEIFNIKNKLISQCNADLVSEYDENGIYSCTAFSKDMGRFIRIGGKKVNLNIAIRYSDTDNKTYIYLATPVIRTEV